MLNRVIKKISKCLIVFLIILGISFSNIPFYALTGLIDSYEKTNNIVDRAWHLSPKSNIVDNFIPSYRNKNIALLDKLAGNLKINEAHATTSYVGGVTCSRAGSTGTTLACSLTALTGGSNTSPSQDDIVIAVVSTGSVMDRAIGVTNVGYTELPELYANGTSYDTNLSVSWKIMGVTPDSSVIFGPSGNATDAISAVVHVWRGVDMGTPFDVTNQSATGTATGRPNPPPITPVTSGATVIAIGAGAAGTGVVYTVAGLSNFRTVASSDSYDSMTGMGSFAWSSGAYDPAQFGGGTTNATDSWASYTLALRPFIDTTPPTPDPMTFATPPTNSSASQIDMTATTASDPSTPINYLFTNDNSGCAANAGTGGTSSSWQAGTTYSDTGLDPNKCYGYTVQARDSLSNTGTASGISSTYTSANTLGTPTLNGATESTLNLTNAENSNPAANPTTNFAVQVVTTTPNDAIWLNQWVDASGNPSASVVWLTDAQLDALVLQGLQASTLYGVKVKAKNNDNEETALSAEGQGTTSAPSNALTVSTTGSQAANLNSGDAAQHIGGGSTVAFQLRMSTTAVNVNTVKLTEQGGSITLSDLTSQKLYYESASTCTYNGSESNVTASPSGETVTFSLTGVQAPIAPNYLCLYYVFDLDGTNAVGGETIDIEITNPSTDIVLASGQNTDTAAKQLTGTTTVLPDATSVSYQGGSFPDGAQSGYSATITGVGFGVAGAGADRANCSGVVNTGCVRFIVGGNATVASSDVTAWSSTSITFTVDAALASNGGVSGLEVVAGSQADASDLNFYVYPYISTIAYTTGLDASRECVSTDTDCNDTDTHGLFKINGNHLGASLGTVQFTGNFGSISATVHTATDGPCNVGGWAVDGTSICVETDPSIFDSVYVGDITLTRTGDSKTDNWTSFRILPRIISNTPSSGVEGDVVRISGNHFCQTETCPVSPNRNTASNNVQFGSTPAMESDFVDKTPSCGGADSGAAWTHTDICVKVPSGTPIDSQPTKVTTTDGVTTRTSNTKAFSVATTVPNNPDVGPAASKGQFKSDGSTAISIGGGTNQTTVVFKMEMSGGANMTIEPQVEVDPVVTAFAADNISAGTPVSYSGAPVTGTVTVSGLGNGLSFHWRARVRNTGTNEYSSWVVFGGNNDGSPADTDFYTDASAPTITVGPSATPLEFSATIDWTTDESATSTVNYGPTQSYDFTATGASGTSHSVSLSGLNCGTTYNYEVVSVDGLNNTATSSNSTFSTSACVTRIMRTVEYQWKQELNQIVGSSGNASGAYSILSAYIKESDSAISSSFVIDNAILEFSGVVKGTGSGNPTANIKINSLSYPTAVSLPNLTSPNLFQMRYNIPNPNTAGNIYISPRDASTNDVYYQFTNVDRVSALNIKLVVTYYYTPL